MSLPTVNRLGRDRPGLMPMTSRTAARSQRGRVNEGENVELALRGNVRWAYNLLLHPQLFPHAPQAGSSDEAQACHDRVRAAERQRAGSTKILRRPLDRPEERNIVCGDKITIADYFGAALVNLAARSSAADFSAYPNIERSAQQCEDKLPSWPKINEVFYGLVESVRRTGTCGRVPRFDLAAKPANASTVS